MRGVSQGPARGYTWAPFQPQHSASVKSGASGKRYLSPVVEELRAHVTEVAPWCSAPAFAPVLEAWCWAEARAVLYRRWFDEQGLFQDEGAPRVGQVEADRAETRAASLRAELGLTPKSLVDILGKLAAHEPEAMAGALEALRATGAQIRQAAEQRQIAAAAQDEETGDDE